MANKRKQYNPQFKARVALEAIRGEKTIAQLASDHQLHPNLIHNWKKQLLAAAPGIFESVTASAASIDNQAQLDELYRQIGQLMRHFSPEGNPLTRMAYKVERDFLASRSAVLGKPSPQSPGDGRSSNFEPHPSMSVTRHWPFQLLLSASSQLR
jgi:transposase